MLQVYLRTAAAQFTFRCFPADGQSFGESHRTDWYCWLILYWESLRIWPKSEVVKLYRFRLRLRLWPKKSTPTDSNSVQTSTPLPAALSLVHVILSYSCWRADYADWDAWVARYWAVSQLFVMPANGTLASGHPSFYTARFIAVRTCLVNATIQDQYHNDAFLKCNWPHKHNCHVKALSIAW